MKTYVWTGRGYDCENNKQLSPKCIFIGDLDFIPRKGDSIVFRENFCDETVKSVGIDVVKKEVTVRIDGCDTDNEYGECLYRKLLRQTVNTENYLPKNIENIIRKTIEACEVSNTDIDEQSIVNVIANELGINNKFISLDGVSKLIKKLKGGK